MSDRPRKTRRAINEPGHAHFITFTCYRRLPLLSRDRSRRWMVEAFAEARKKQNLLLWAYVIMPEHVHALLLPKSHDYEMRRVLAALKAPVSKRAHEFLRETGNARWLDALTVKKGDRSSFRFWQAGGGYDENLWNERPIREVIDYIHANPVRRGLAERPTDWLWSSARFHAGICAGPLATDPVELN